MSELGQQRTSSAMPIYVRLSPNSRHSLADVRYRADFVCFTPSNSLFLTKFDGRPNSDIREGLRAPAAFGQKRSFTGTVRKVRLQITKRPFGRRSANGRF